MWQEAIVVLNIDKAVLDCLLYFINNKIPCLLSEQQTIQKAKSTQINPSRLFPAWCNTNLDCQIRRSCESFMAVLEKE